MATAPTLGAWRAVLSTAGSSVYCRQEDSVDYATNYYLHRSRRKPARRHQVFVRRCERCPFAIRRLGAALDFGFKQDPGRNGAASPSPKLFPSLYCRERRCAVRPKGYFPFPIEGSTPNGEYEVVVIGESYVTLRAALKEIGQALGCRLQGFGDLSVEEVARLTGLSSADAVLATQREYDEPFVVVGDEIALEPPSEGSGGTRATMYARRTVLSLDGVER